MIHLVRSLVVLCVLTAFAQAATIEKIQFSGLQRVSIGTALNSAGIEVGDELSSETIANTVRRLYRTGYFTEIEAFQDRENGVVEFRVIEQPAIASLDFNGNKKINSDVLEQVFKDARLSEDEVLNRGALEQIVAELERQYSSMGLYNARIDVEVTPLPRNKVDLKIDIDEGKMASIANIEIVGNELYADEELASKFSLAPKKVGQLMSNKDKYSSQIARADQEKLRAFYLDRGHLRFELISTQVSLSSNKKDIFITYNIFEGDQFDISDVKLGGDLVGDEEKLTKLLTVSPGEQFSRRKVSAVQQDIQDRLGELGYAFAKISAIPDIDDDSKTVALTFFVEPGNRTYIRRVQITGNKGTDDEVLRREVIQMEGALASSKSIGTSKRRLERSGYYESVQITTPAVPGTDDQIDMNISVVESKDGQITGTMGYQDPGGFFVSAEYSQKNFAGSGKDVTTKIISDQSEDEFTFSYKDPFFTLDGVSLSWDLFLKRSDYSDILSESNTGRIGIDRVGGSFTFGYPISNDSRLSYGLGYKETTVHSNKPSLEIQDFLDDHGDQFGTFDLQAGYSYSTLNGGAASATDGTSHRLTLSSSIPGNDLDYYKISYTGRFYEEFIDGYTLRLRSDLAYGSGFNETKTLPFFENYYVGGANTVRGFRYGSIGPESQPDPDISNPSRAPFGGNIKIAYGFDVFFPMPLAGDSNMFRPSVFVDAGSAFTDYCIPENDECFEGIDWEEIRYSYGFELNWVTPIAPLRFIWAWPYDKREGDNTQLFTFTFGYSF